MTSTLSEERIKFLEFLDLVQGLPEDHHVSCAQVHLRSIPDERLRHAVQMQIDAYLSKIKMVGERKKVVVLVHGIRTQAEWFSVIRNELENFEGFEVEQCKYDYHNLFQFLFPIFTRIAPVTATLRNLNSIIAQHGEADYYLISHSNGTDVMCKIMQDSPHITFKGIIFCGSVVNENFRWDTYKGFPTKMFVNEIGTKDIMPFLAKFTTIGYGAAGRFGFNYHGIKNRYHDLGHSGFFSQDFVAQFWIPFLVEGRLLNSAWDTARPKEKWFVQVLGTVPGLLWLLLFLLVLVIVAVV